jgi:exodeoxyribonuclease VII small subunit
LDESIEVFEKGMEMSNFCSKKLDEAERKINILIQNKDGKYDEVPFVTEED